MISVAIMAHPARAEYVEELQGRLDRPAKVVWDERQDRWDTGRRSMLAYDPSASHHLVVQDDAVIPRDFVAGVEAALAHAPQDVPLCLYVGRVRPYRALVNKYVALAEGKASWLVMDQLVWGVAIVMPTKFIEPMVAWCDGQHIPNYDTRMSRWLEYQQIRTWYPWPSLVDHRESPSLVPGRGHAGRIAHRFIGADASALDIDYSGAVLRLPHPQSSLPGGQPAMLFVSEKHDNLSVPTIGVRFVDGLAEANTRGAIAYLQQPHMRRRGVRLATAEEQTAWYQRTLTVAEPAPAAEGAIFVTEPAPVLAPEGTVEVTEPAGDEPAEVPDEAPAETDGPVEEAPDSDPVPDGTADEVLAWVDGDADRALAAAGVERGREKPRKVLLGKLEAIAA